MMTKMTPTESRMLEEVRRWRREVYEADQIRSAEDRARCVEELARSLGLRTAPPRVLRKRDTH